MPEIKYASPIDEKKYGSYSALTDSVDSFEEETFRFGERIGKGDYPAESGRYHIYLQYVCPWAQRVQIIIDYLGLGNVISYSYLDPLRDARGWAFRERTGPDPVNGFTLLRDAYLATASNFKGVPSVPAVWDRKTARLINNRYDDTIHDFSTAFANFQTPGVDIFPVELREEIDKLLPWISEKINEGVYELAFALTQQKYDLAVENLYAALDSLEERLSRSRYLFGNRITLADICLWVTLARFDLVYYPLFRANRRRLIDFPNLWGYARELYAIPAFKKGSRFDYIKETYYTNFAYLLYKGIIPALPELDWDAPHDRIRLS
ncbi:glutathione S-transferase C-terminal domain-containing protein [Treponema primitia]|uniref:glutathione S-transferase C-terminal domain-containing protein n=1 Tax=Treponema primitia TaxID=88058 RepID=UPI00025552C4|nr:glutathione S-transferase C-terminal domain-containing protein [Treponema primitia]